MSVSAPNSGANPAAASALATIAARRSSIASTPTPVQQLATLGKQLAVEQLLVKRDDLTGLAFGGNKTRKLEFLLAEAAAAGAKMLITAGAIQSNHCRQTAAAAASQGLDCQLVLTGQPSDKEGGNYLLDNLLGAEIIFISDRKDRDRVLQEAFSTAQQQGRQPFLLPYGGSSPTGALAYAHALGELLTQLQHHPDCIVLASSSGGTQAGLVLGARIFGYRGRIVGISIDESSQQLQSKVASLANKASQLLGQDWKFAPQEIEVDDSYCQAGYGVLTTLEQDAMQVFARQEGLLVDPVYTGRAAGGLLDLSRRKEIAGQLLFWHTGGQVALFAERYNVDTITSK